MLSREGQSRALWFGPWAGAYNRQDADATAFPHRSQLFILEHEASVSPTATVNAKLAAAIWARESRDSVRRWGSGRVYPAFADPDLAEWERAHYAEHRARLREIKSSYDPDNRLAGKLTIPLP